MQNKQTLICDKAGNSFPAKISYTSEQGIPLLTLDAETLKLEAEGADYFRCLVDIRLQLEKKGLYVLCKGSAINVYPSRMSLSMSGGLKAYQLTLGKHGSLSDLVDIFDPISVSDVGTVAEQEAFYGSWIKSLANVK